MASTVEVMADAFKESGTPFIVGHPGGETVELMDAASKRDMRYILMKQETAGAILAARMEKIPVILDGYASLAVAAVLKAAAPAAIDHCLLGHVSTEPGMARAASVLGLAPLVELSLGDGEGAGAAIAAGIVRNAALTHSGMAIRPE